MSTATKTDEENVDLGATRVESAGESVPTDMKAEIEGAVEVAVTEIEKERKERNPDDKDENETVVEEVEKPEVVVDPPVVDATAITDELVERAVKAGMSISDAKTFQKADALGRMCDMLEKGSKKADEVKVVDEVDPLAAIPDLDPEKYDEQVVAGFKAMKDIIRTQQAAIKAGQSEGGKAQATSWFDGQVAALGSAFAESVGTGDRAKLDPNGPQVKKLAELEGKFDVLKAGYKAAGKEVDGAIVFKEAVAFVLGDVQAKADSSVKARGLGERRNLHIQRPSGVTAKPQADAFGDVAAALDKKFFKR